MKLELIKSMRDTIDYSVDRTIEWEKQLVHCII